MSSVIRPSSWPVITAGPPTGARSRSNITPCAGFSLTFDSTGSFSAINCDTSARLASSTLSHSSALSRSVESGTVRSSRHERQNGFRRASALSGSSQLHGAAESQLAQRRYVVSGTVMPIPRVRIARHTRGSRVGASGRSSTRSGS